MSFDTAQPSYVARYPFVMPDDKRGLICDYYGRLIIRQGPLSGHLNSHEQTRMWRSSGVE